jgi:tetratricopeptide (TPR) repeat protein
MVALETSLERASWGLRPVEFRELREYDDGRAVVAMEFRPTDSGLLSRWRQLGDLWMDLSPHPHILDAMDRVYQERFLLRYAALDWKHRKLSHDADPLARARFGSWAVQVTDAFQAIAEQVPKDIGRFLNPMLLIDVGHAARLAFMPVFPGDAVESGALPPEELDTWPRRADTTTVYVIGRLLRDLCLPSERYSASQLDAIVGKCLEPSPSDRYQTLGELRAAWIGAGATNDAIRKGTAFTAWDLAEEGAGWLALGRTRQALDLFEDALEVDPRSELANTGRHRALELLDVVTTPSRQSETKLSLAEAKLRGSRLEAERAYSEALEVYQSVDLHGSNDVAINAAVARCYLGVGASGPAIDFAQRVLARQPKNADALAVRSRAYLLAREYDQALSSADAWVAALPEDAAAHYTRGRSLFSLGRLQEAREAFERACTLKPDMLEAMLLRREADRAIRKLQSTVGTQPQLEVPLPEHLSELRSILASGRIADLTAALTQPQYDNDAAAKLVHGRCLAFEQRHDEAVAMFDRALHLSPDVQRDAVFGKAHSLLALDRPADALRLFDDLLASAPTDLDIIEGRALALVKLGRDAEAERELQRLFAASGGRSELRTAQLRP